MKLLYAFREDGEEDGKVLGKLQKVGELVHTGKLQMAGFKVSPLIKGVMKLTRNDFSSLVNKAIKLMKIDTNGFYNKKL